MIKAVIFDMDGVVIDTGLIHSTAEKKVLNEIGIDITLEEIRKYAGAASNVWFKEVLKRHSKVADVYELKRKKFDIVYENLEKDIPVVPGVLRLIDSLRKNKIKLALASGSPKEFVNFIVSRLNLDEKFDEVIGLGDYSGSKPDPELFLLASRKLGVDPKDCVVVEDAHLGVLAAKNAGMKCVGFINEKSGNQDLSKADLIVDDLNELTLDKIQNLKS
ncbi:MAG: HAD family phosphatase [Candidatus Bathyarchaeota archaeon]|nr:HAD family phosphatase [Candidatus Bathyarchaeota archaeon]